MYFSSNNILTDSQTDIFLKWVIDEKHADLLKTFLQAKTPTIQAFSTRILESGTRIKKTKFLKHLITSGVKFDGVLEEAMEIDDSEFLTLLLHSGVDPNLLSGYSGGRLLRKIAQTPYVDIAQFLIQSGADVNLHVGGAISTNSLCEAIESRSIGMVKCLLDSGAEVDTYCRLEYGPCYPLGLAVFRRKLDIVVALLEKGASVSRYQLFGKNLLEWSALNARDIHQVLVEKTARSSGPLPIGDIVYAAEAGTLPFAKFLRTHKATISQTQLEKALTESLSHSKFRAILVLLENGVDPNGSTLEDSARPLMASIAADGIKYSELLINKGASVNLPGVLVSAVDQDNFELVNLLIDKGADLETYGPEALEMAAKYGNIEIAALLLDRGTAINNYGKVFTGLQAVVESGTVAFAKYLIERGADVNAPASAVGGRTALQAAAEEGDLEMVARFLEQHADVNAPPALPQRLAALEAAISGWRSNEVKGKIFKLLLDNGASINRPGYEASTILHDLIKQGQENLIRLAVEAGININHMSSGMEGKTHLQTAASEGDLKVVKLLLEQDAEVNAPPGYKHGRTALQAGTSSERPQIEIVQLLIDNDANINARAGVAGGITALQGAAIHGHFNIARILLQMGADVNARPAIINGRTAIEGAAEHGRLDMVKLLLNARARGDVTGKTGFKKAIELAEKNRHFAIVELLRTQQVEDGDS